MAPAQDDRTRAPDVAGLEFLARGGCDAFDGLHDRLAASSHQKISGSTFPPNPRHGCGGAPPRAFQGLVANERAVRGGRLRRRPRDARDQTAPTSWPVGPILTIDRAAWTVVSTPGCGEAVPTRTPTWLEALPVEPVTRVTDTLPRTPVGRGDAVEALSRARLAALPAVAAGWLVGIRRRHTSLARWRDRVGVRTGLHIRDQPGVR
jgi:hypothetical protein